MERLIGIITVFLTFIIYKVDFSDTMAGLIYFLICMVSYGIGCTMLAIGSWRKQKKLQTFIFIFVAMFFFIVHFITKQPFLN